MEARVFKWFGYVSLRPQDVANGLHLYYILSCIIFWMITMCCEVSYLYIGLLTQLSYLTYVGFLNKIEHLFVVDSDELFNGKISVVKNTT
jgi:hypothetical protein